MSRPSRPAPPRRLLASFALLLASLALIEGTLQLVTRLAPDSPAIQRLAAATTTDFSDPDFSWKKRFLALYDDLEKKAIPISRQEYEPDPLLGWVPRKNVRLTVGRRTFTTNSMGFRALHDYTRDRERFTVLIVGDSFTYSSGADDSEVWPTLLQGLDDRLQVINLAVGGYGTDQMYLMLERHIERFMPELVITAVISDNLARSTLSFRDYQKPRFRIEDDRLVLTNTPIGGLHQVAAQVRREIRMKRMLSELRLLGVVMNTLALRRPAASAEARAPPVEQLNRKIVGAMAELCRRHGAELMLLYLPRGEELTDVELERPAEAFLEQLSREHGTHHLNPRGRFLASDHRFSRGHYRRAGATLVAETVHRKLLELYGEPLTPRRGQQ